jgi:ATP-dependent Clp protease ATP-binding subunit ClpA
MTASRPTPPPLAVTENTRAFARRVAELAAAQNRKATRRDWLLQLLAADRLDLSTHLLHAIGADTESLRVSFASSSPDSDPWLVEAPDHFLHQEIASVAREAGHDYIGTEHILLAFARAPGPSGSQLRAAGITWDRVWRAFNAIEWADSSEFDT